MKINCSDCSRYTQSTQYKAGDSSACEDCVVTLILSLDENKKSLHGAELQIADTHMRALSVLAESGLVPPLRFGS